MTPPRFLRRLLIPWDSALAALVISGALGFWIGCWWFPTWQAVLETAQVVAGLVVYPRDNPFFIYHVKLWSVLHEVLAILLRAGVSEITLSEILSGLLGLVSLQALTLFVFAFSRDAVYSACAAAVLVLTGAAQFSGFYPIGLMGTEHTYGALGLSALVLILGAFGAGSWRVGALLLGFLPALHPSIGVWGGVIVAGAVAVNVREIRSQLRVCLPWFSIGCALTLVSLGVHLWLARGIPPVDRATADAYLNAVIAAGEHRRAGDIGNLGVYLRNPAVQLNAVILPLAFFCLTVLRDRLQTSAAFLLRILIVSATLALALISTSLVPAPWVPGFLEVLMPLRLLNIVGMTFVAVAWGLIGTSGSAVLRGIVVAVAGWLVLGTWLSLEPFPPRSVRFSDRTHDPVFSRAAEGDGLLLTGGSLQLVQLRTRRPVLLDGGGLDGLAYALDAGPSMNHILQDVYGIRMWSDVVPDEPNRQLWETYSPKRWQTIRRDYNVTQVLTPAGWHLNLPAIAESGDLRLFEIPK